MISTMHVFVHTVIFWPFFKYSIHNKYQKKFIIINSIEIKKCAIVQNVQKSRCPNPGTGIWDGQNTRNGAQKYGISRQTERDPSLIYKSKWPKNANELDGLKLWSKISGIYIDIWCVWNKRRSPPHPKSWHLCIFVHFGTHYNIAKIITWNTFYQWQNTAWNVKIDGHRRVKEKVCKDQKSFGSDTYC